MVPVGDVGSADAHTTYRLDIQRIVEYIKYPYLWAR